MENNLKEDLDLLAQIIHDEKRRLKRNERARAYCKTEQYKQWHRSYRQREVFLDNRRITMKHTFKDRIGIWKRSAAKRNIAWQLTDEFLETLPRTCHYTKESLTCEPNKPNTVSLDRIDSSKDYSPDNVVLCATIVNYMKSDYSIDEFKEWCRKIVNN